LNTAEGLGCLLNDFSACCLAVVMLTHFKNDIQFKFHYSKIQQERKQQYDEIKTDIDVLMQ
jgi:hypothetical protein